MSQGLYGDRWEAEQVAKQQNQPIPGPDEPTSVGMSTTEPIQPHENSSNGNRVCFLPYGAKKPCVQICVKWEDGVLVWVPNTHLVGEIVDC